MFAAALGLSVFNFFVQIVGHVLTWLFAIGIVGCFFVIPITAYRLVSVLFEKDHPDERNPPEQHAI
jgi:hypothetical protein